MADERFLCKACGHTVENPDRNRFTLSITRPAVCPACNAPHVYDFGVQLDEGWVKRQINELADLKRLERGERADGAEAPDRPPTGSRSSPRLRGAPQAREGRWTDRHDDRAYGTQG